MIGDFLRGRRDRVTVATRFGIVREPGRYGRRIDNSPAQIALAWSLARHRHVLPIPGTKRARYVIENAAAADIATLDRLFAPEAVAGARYPAEGMKGIET